MLSDRHIISKLLEDYGVDNYQQKSYQIMNTIDKTNFDIDQIKQNGDNIIELSIIDMRLYNIDQLNKATKNIRDKWNNLTELEKDNILLVINLDRILENKFYFSEWLTETFSGLVKLLIQCTYINNSEYGFNLFRKLPETLKVLSFSTTKGDTSLNGLEKTNIEFLYINGMITTTNIKVNEKIKIFILGNNTFNKKYKPPYITFDTKLKICFYKSICGTNDCIESIHTNHENTEVILSKALGGIIKQFTTYFYYFECPDKITEQSKLVTL